MAGQDFHQLKRAWQQHYPNQASGGHLALQGFDFQFTHVLLKTVQNWISLDGVQRTMPGVLGEYLSDIAETTAGGSVVVTQVKLTQSYSAVSHALKDLYGVYLVAVASTPDLLAGLQFRILSARADIPDADKYIKRWDPQDGSTPATIADFLSRVKFEISADPFDELISLLVNALGAPTPVTLVQGWLGRLIAASAESGAYRQVAHSIWNDLTSLATDRATRGGSSLYMWTAADRQPVDTVPGGVLTGQQPTVAHLREGYFAPRTAVSTGIAADVAEWSDLHEQPLDGSLRLPLFWISGRSGAGKSVALIQVLAELHGTGQFSIVFPHSVSELPSAIRWSAQLLRAGKRVIIALDDPYTPGAQGDADALWRDALAQLHSFRQSGDADAIPLVLCCGPTEQAERLTSDLPDDVDVRMRPVENDGDVNLAELREWYRGRTGSAPPELAAGNVLLVQLFFEWRVKQTLPAFAARLRKRILAQDGGVRILDALSRILSLNRIYVGACTRSILEGLSAADRDFIDTLRRENHLAESSELGRPGLWLSHPHLAEAIYVNWHPARDRNVRREHLIVAINGSLTHGATPIERTAPLWALSRAIGGARKPSMELAERIDPECVGAVLETVYASSVGSVQGIELSLLPVWVKVKSVAPQVRLLPDPIEVALAGAARAGADEQGLRLVCHKLLEALQSGAGCQAQSICDTVIGVLTRLADWHEWGPVALHALVAMDDPRLIDLATAWAEQHPGNRLANSVTMKCLERFPGNERVLAVARNAVEGRVSSVYASNIVGKLLELRGPAPAFAMAWVEQNRLSAEVPRLLAHLLQQDELRYTGWCLEWLGRWSHARGASRVLMPLLIASPSPDVASYCCGWVRQRHARSGFVMRRLLEVFPADDEVLALGVQWISWVASDSGEWNYVLEKVLSAFPGDQELASTATSWLTSTALDHGSWSFVWQALWESGRRSDGICTLGRDWLRTVTPSQKSWGYVWGRLWEGDENRDALHNIGRWWLECVPFDHGAWAMVWQDLWRDAPGDDALVNRAIQWLEAVEGKGPTWCPIAAHVVIARTGDQVLHAKVLAWLSECPSSQYGWQRLWTALSRLPVTNDEGVLHSLHEVMARLLTRVDVDEKVWIASWQDLWKVVPDNTALYTAGLSWLDATDSSHDSWVRVFSRIWDVEASRAMAASCGCRGLSALPLEHASWPFIWLKLWSSGVCDRGLLFRDCITWLEQHDLRTKSWASVWTAANMHEQTNHRVLEAGLSAVSGATLRDGKWLRIFNVLSESDGFAVRLTGVAREWLRQTPVTDESWSNVWLGQRRVMGHDAELFELGLGWFRHPGSPAFNRYEVFNSLLRECPSDAGLTAAGRTWLETITPQDPAWPKIWNSLWNLESNDDSLLVIAHAWLGKLPQSSREWMRLWYCVAEFRHPSLGGATFGEHWLSRYDANARLWPRMWTYLWEREPARQALYEVGMGWLAAVAADNPSWSEVWYPLLQERGNSPELRMAAERWLGYAPKHHKARVFVAAKLSKLNKASRSNDPQRAVARAVTA
ncbi:hypothetical protein ACIGHF_02535 [Stenotrophomonas sp. NPDC077464]|uniref:hypothetical protein n=1 Tax=unclassified Stenotrophomonas TaxID=196198 RepID=UPI0037D151BB